VLHARVIMARGTSAHEQTAVYYEAKRSGANREEALKAVVDHLIAATVSH
jgi:carboxylate-amine ligase